MSRSDRVARSTATTEPAETGLGRTVSQATWIEDRSTLSMNQNTKTVP